MVAGSKRRKPIVKGLAPGERIKRDKLNGREGEYSQWGWINHIKDPSLITTEHILTSYGFLDKLRKPVCKNKWTKLKDASKSADEPTTEGSVKDSVRATDKPKDGEDIIVIASDDEDLATCDKKKCKENTHCLNYLGQAKLENERSSSPFSISTTNV